MARALKFFCFSISILLILQLVDSAPRKSKDSDTNSNGQDEEEVKPTLFKNVERLANSRAGKIARQLSNKAIEKASKFSKDFKNTLIEDSKNQVSGENDLISNGIKNNVYLPIKAAAQTGLKTIGEPVGQMISNIKKTYDEELEKSDQDENYVPIIGAFTKRINKPVAIIKASKNIFGGAIGGLQKTASSIWNFGKTDEGIEKRDKKIDKNNRKKKKKNDDKNKKKNIQK